MAKTVIQAFVDFRRNLEITTLQASTVATRQQKVRSNINASMVVVDDFLTGSYMRSTLIAPLKDADVDVFVILDPKYFDNTLNGAANVREKVKRVLDNAYSEATKISRDGQAITIKFSEFMVDVVPAFNRQGGGYLIPDPRNRKWIETNPKKHVELWAQSNSYHGGNLVPLIKMIKAWNRAHSWRFESFHLETVVRQVFSSWKISNFADASAYFFQNASSNLVTVDPAGYGGTISSYMTNNNTTLLDVITSLNSAATKSKEALEYNRLGNNEQAIKKWGVIFGDYFPSYG